MLSKTNKTRLLGAIITLITAGVISISAQTPDAVNSLTAKPDSTRETGEKDVEKKSPLAAEGSKPTAGSEGAVSSGAEVSDPARANAGVNLAKVADKGPTVRSAKTSAQATSSDEWEFQITPYIVLGSLHGTSGIGNRSTEVDMSFGDIFGALKFALMGVFEARKGKWMFLTGGEYISVETDKATPGPLFSNVTAGFKTFIFDADVGYRLYNDPDKGASVDVLGGIRLTHVSTNLNFGAGILPATQVDGSRNWVDAIVGLRGKAAVSEKIFVTGKADLGGGGSHFTWQLFGGLGYSITPKIALIGGYSVLDVDYDKNNFIYDMNQRGPTMGLAFKF
jgi:hypothetical protein